MHWDKRRMHIAGALAASLAAAGLMPAAAAAATQSGPKQPVIVLLRNQHPELPAKSEAQTRRLQSMVPTVVAESMLSSPKSGIAVVVFGTITPVVVPLARRRQHPARLGRGLAR